MQELLQHSEQKSSAALQQYSWSSAESTDFIPAQNQLLHNRYQIVSHLGTGAYSTVWKCSDLQSGQLIALKIHKCETDCARAAKLEYNILTQISHPNVLRAIDKFVHYDADITSQKYYCIVYELCDGDLDKYCIAASIERSISLRINKAAHIMRQLLLGLAQLHSHNIMHLDIKPENILVANVATTLSEKYNDKMTSQHDTNLTSVIFKIADFSAAKYTYATGCGVIGTRNYRAPEILLGLPHMTACDIWAMGCILFELCTGDILFEPHQYRNYRITRDEDHLALMIELIGPFPQWMLSGSRRKLFLRKNGKPRHIPQLYPWRLVHVMRDRYKIIDHELLDLLQSMLALDPHERPSAEQCMAHPWFNSAVYQK